MPSNSRPRTRKLTIIAQDPSVRVANRMLTTEVEIPAEQLDAGPRGYRVHVIDYDSSTESRTEVPRQSLVNAMTASSDYHTTQSAGTHRQLFIEMSIPLSQETHSGKAAGSGRR